MTAAIRLHGWTELALCAEVDAELFFPEPDAQAADARALCRSCECRVRCLEWALDHWEEGVWGGFTESARKKEVRPQVNKGRTLEDIIAADDAGFYARAEKSADLAAAYAVKKNARARERSAAARGALESREAA